MNVELLQKVKRHILEEPRRFKMSNFINVLGQGGRSTVWDMDAPKTKPVKFAKCGTAACIGGWAIVLNGVNAQDAARFSYTDIEHASRCVLDLDSEQSRTLLFVRSWPEKFRNKYAESRSLKAKATIAAKRIDHFIKTKGAE